MRKFLRRIVCLFRGHAYDYSKAVFIDFGRCNLGYAAIVNRPCVRCGNPFHVVSVDLLTFEANDVQWMR